MALSKLILLTQIVLFGMCAFQIYSPDSAKSALPQNIPYTIANFGHIPYGSTLIGKLLLSKPGNLCSPNQTIGADLHQQPFFLLGERGTCKFTAKALNAQKSGAKLAIIEDSRSSGQGVIMSNDGYGFLVDIPSIFISYDDGQKLKKVLEKSESVVVMIKFETQKSDKAQLSFWLDPNERHSFVLVRDLAEYEPKLNDAVSYQVYYRVLEKCTLCDADDCLYKGQWCILTKSNFMTGKDMVVESIRQAIILEQDKKKWWKYIDKFDMDCSITKGHKECSEQVMKDLGLDAKDINSKVDEQVKLAAGDNTHMMKSWIEMGTKGNIVFYPDVTVNNVNYHGELTAPAIFQMLCNSLNNPPADCITKAKESEPVIPIPHGSLAPTIILIIVLSSLGFLLLLIIYRRVIRKEMQQEMNSQVNQMVSQYISFYNDKSTQ